MTTIVLDLRLREPVDRQIVIIGAKAGDAVREMVRRMRDAFATLFPPTVDEALVLDALRARYSVSRELARPRRLQVPTPRHVAPMPRPAWPVALRAFS